MPLSERGYMRRGRSAYEDRKEIRRLYRRYRIDRAKRSIGRWAGRILLVALGVVLTLLAQEFWPGITEDLTRDMKSRTQDFLGPFSSARPIIRDYEEPASSTAAGPTPYSVATPTPIRPGPAVVEPTPTTAPEPTPTMRPINTPTPSVPQKATDEWILAVESEVHRLTNEERVKRSLRPLSYDPVLASIAQGHSKDMAQLDYFDHDNLRGQAPSDRAGQAGYRCRKDCGSYYTVGIAENIFQTWLFSSYTTSLSGLVVSRNYMTMEEIASQVVDGWINSPGHRENILNARYDREGIGIAVSSDGKVYVTQNFC